MELKKTRLIKRYQNRKLYDTGVSQYISLDTIYKLQCDHADFIVIENKTKLDITSKVVIQSMLPKLDAEDREEIIRHHFGS